MTKRIALIVGCVALILVGVGIFLATRSQASETGGKSLHGDEGAAVEGSLLAVAGAPSESVVKEYEGFVVAFNPANGTPDWVSWELTAEETRGQEPRSNKFWQDADLEGCPSPDDYKRSGYSKGHMCPSADQKWSAQAMNDCFVMANMCPQSQELNNRAWKTLENKERLWAEKYGAVVIVAGPVYEPSDTKRIGQGRVRVPSAFYKVLLDARSQPMKAIGFIYPNSDAPGNMQNYSMSVDDVERITGLDFFSALPDDIEDEVESKASFRQWAR